VSAYILQEKDLTKEKISAATGVCLFIATILGSIFFFGASTISRFYGNPQLTLIVRVLCLNFIFVAFASIGSAQLRREMMFQANMNVSLLANSANAVVSTGLAALGAGAISLAWGSLAGVTMTVMGNSVALGKHAFCLPSIRNWRPIAHFGVFSSASGILSALADRTPDLVVGRLVSLEGAGLFSRGNGLITLFRTALTSAIDPVISSSLAMMHRADQDVREPLLRIFSYLTAVGWPALCVLGLLAHPIIVVVFGPKWIGSVHVAQLLCVGAALSLIGNICQTYLNSTGAVRKNFVIQAISVPIFISGIAFGALHSLEGAALGAATTGALITFISLQMLKQRIGLGWLAIARSVLPSVAITAITAAPALAVVCLVDVEAVNPWGPSLLSGAGAMVAWLASIQLMRHPLRQEVAHVANWFISKFQRSFRNTNLR